MKTEKYSIITYHCEAFCIDIEVSKTKFEKMLKDAKQQADTDGVTEEANDKGEYIETCHRETQEMTTDTFIVGCGCSETQFIKRVCKAGYAFK